MKLFREGGPNQVRRIGADKYKLSVRIPSDESGMVGRECPSDSCSPAYFKIRPGTGLTGEQSVAYCPYCRMSSHPAEFHTESQIAYARAVAVREATPGINEMLREALGLDYRGKRSLDAGFVSIEMSLTPLVQRPLSRPAEEELQRDVVCHNCGLEHGVFGLAVWCPDCGEDLFLEHVRAELAVVQRVLAAIPERRAQLGARVAARDVENELEDVVSIFEAVLKAICRLHLRNTGVTEDDIASVIEMKVRNRFQSVAFAANAFREILGRELFVDIAADDLAAISQTFEKRHPITHNLGVVDRKYMRRINSGEFLGREVLVSVAEVVASIGIAERVFARAYTGQ